MKIGLFIPCYVDVVYPEVGVATYNLKRNSKVSIMWYRPQSVAPHSSS